MKALQRILFIRFWRIDKTLKISATTRFKRDVKMCQKRKYDLDLLYSVIDTLAIPKPLEAQSNDHNLKGNYERHRECHITSDWMLIYRIINGNLYLDRTGTHSDLFKK